MNIPVFIYKILAPLIAPTVSMLFNNSLSEGIFRHTIIPIFKSGDSNSTANYKPISMLPFLSKMFEKLMCARGLLPKIEQYFMYKSVWFPQKISIHRMQLPNFLIMFIYH